MNSRFLSLILPFISYCGIFLISLFVINSSIYTSDLRLLTYNNGSQWLFLGYFTISLIIFYFFYKISNIRTLKFNISDKQQGFLLFSIFLLVIFYFVPIAIHGPALLRGMNRYQFLELSYVKFFNIKVWISMLCYVLGFLYSSRKRSSIFLFIFVILTALMYGEKGSGPILMITFFLSGLMMRTSRNVRVLTLIKIGAIGIVSLFTIYVLQLLFLSLEIDVVLNAFENRLGRQSQLFWAFCNLFPFKDSEINLDMIFGSVSDENTISTMHYMMELVMPKDEFLSFEGSLAGGYPSVLLLLVDTKLGFLFLSATLSIIYIVVIYFFFVSLFKITYTVYVLPILYFGFTVHLKVFQTGNLSLFFNEKYLVILLLSFLFYFLYLIKIISRNKNESDIYKAQ